MIQLLRDRAGVNLEAASNRLAICGLLSPRRRHDGRLQRGLSCPASSRRSSNAGCDSPRSTDREALDIVRSMWLRRRRMVWAAVGRQEGLTRKHKDTKTRRHQGRPQINTVDVASLGAFVSLCLCVFSYNASDFTDVS